MYKNFEFPAQTEYLLCNTGMFAGSFFAGFAVGYYTRKMVIKAQKETFGHTISGPISIPLSIGFGAFGTGVFDAMQLVLGYGIYSLADDIGNFTGLSMGIYNGARAAEAMHNTGNKSRKEKKKIASIDDALDD